MMTPKIGIIVFPGSNCDADTAFGLEQAGAEPIYIWHQETKLRDLAGVVLPGGFSYGDYLRTGAIARFSPVMGAVKEFAAEGGLVLGICNGFQILLEAGLLPGAMIRNRDLKFLCEYVTLRPESLDTPFTSQIVRSFEGTPGTGGAGGLDAGAPPLLRIPIAHHDGNYYADDETLDRITARGQVVFRYVNARGEADPASAPNGSTGNIAGVTNEAGNVLGMMPHPERAADPLLGSTDGLGVLRSMVAAAAEPGEVTAGV